MKKVPIIGDLENSMDKMFMDLMGKSFKSFYPLLKMGVIYSNPGSAIAYTTYRSIPYLWDGLTSKKAIESYKAVGKVVGKGALTVGKTVGKSALTVGIGSALLLGKYSGKALMGLGRLSKKQFDNAVEYFSDKDLSLGNVKENLNKFNPFKGKVGTFENNFNDKYKIKQVDNSMLDERIIRQSAAASYLLGISKDEYLNNAKKKIKNGEMEYNEQTGTYYYKGIENKDKDNNIAKEENNRETIEKEDEPLKTIKIGGSDEVVFNKRNGKITRQYNLCGNKGREIEITEEEYIKYIQDAEKNKEISKEKTKERDVEFSL